MKKEYQRPEMEIISLVTEENVTTGGDPSTEGLEGDMGVGSNTLFD